KPVPRTYISSSAEYHADVRIPGSAFPLCQMRRCCVIAGRGCLHDPKTTAGRLPRDARALSRAVAVSSFAIDALAVCAELDILSDLSAALYGGSVTSTSALSHSRCSVRQSPW